MGRERKRPLFLMASEHVTILIKPLVGEPISLEVNPGWGLYGARTALSKALPEEYPPNTFRLFFIDEEKTTLTSESVVGLVSLLPRLFVGAEEEEDGRHDPSIEPTWQINLLEEGSPLIRFHFQFYETDWYAHVYECKYPLLQISKDATPRYGMNSCWKEQVYPPVQIYCEDIMENMRFMEKHIREYSSILNRRLGRVHYTHLCNCGCGVYWENMPAHLESSVHKNIIDPDVIKNAYKENRVTKRRNCDCGCASSFHPVILAKSPTHTMCECGSMVLITGLKRHLLTKKHQEHMKSSS